MGNTKHNGNLSRGDLFSFIAIFIMAILFFFGLNFYTVNLAVSLIAAISFLVVEYLLLSVSVYAKTQDDNLSKYGVLEKIAIVLFVLGLVPVYIFSTPFFNVQTNRRHIIESEGPAEVAEVRKLFSDFDELCIQRKTSYENIMLGCLNGNSQADVMDLTAIFTDTEPTEIMISDEADNQFNLWETSQYRELEEEMVALSSSYNDALDSWDLVHLPEIASKFANEKKAYPSKLSQYYENEEAYTYFEKKIEADDLEFDFPGYKCDSLSEAYFHNITFSLSGLIVFIILAVIGLLRYLVTNRSNKILPSMGKAENEYEIKL